MPRVDPRDTQTEARHASPRTGKRYDRAHTNLGREPSNILAAYIPCGTCDIDWICRTSFDYK